MGKFCLFFDPWFTLFKFKPKNSDTEYAIGWLPLGGYVKISGMIDESMDTEQMKQDPKPYEFRSKAAWKRLLVMIGGVLFNFITALFIYSMILYAWGDEYIRVQDAPIGMSYNQTAKEVGFKDGDILYAADGVAFDRYDEHMLTQVVDARVVTVLRDGKEAAVYIPEDMMQRLMKDSIKFASFRMPFVIESVEANSPASQAGLTTGDQIVALDDIPVSYFEYMDALGKRRDKKLGLDNDSIDLHQIALTYVRNGEEYTTVMRTDST